MARAGPRRQCFHRWLAMGAVLTDHAIGGAEIIIMSYLLLYMMIIIIII